MGSNQKKKVDDRRRLVDPYYAEYPTPPPPLLPDKTSMDMNDQQPSTSHPITSISSISSTSSSSLQPQELYNNNNNNNKQEDQAFSKQPNKDHSYKISLSEQQCTISTASSSQSRKNNNCSLTTAQHSASKGDTNPEEQEKNKKDEENEQYHDPQAVSLREYLQVKQEEERYAKQLALATAATAPSSSSSSSQNRSNHNQQQRLINPRIVSLEEERYEYLASTGNTATRRHPVYPSTKLSSRSSSQPAIYYSTPTSHTTIAPFTYPSISPPAHYIYSTPQYMRPPPPPPPPPINDSCCPCCCNEYRGGPCVDLCVCLGYLLWILLFATGIALVVTSVILINQCPSSSSSLSAITCSSVFHNGLLYGGIALSALSLLFLLWRCTRACCCSPAAPMMRQPK
ncbi:uncharacterized protein BX664DRAFT_332108 [Halteromyces radiatus]|uniref:uncharacterized protein n=1 Tax=Halteromyces radiatus TaxID=101107 RepID=UPI002220D5E1|nr:uncharacterized protein BX664DRAFT_332108 [Halteromyces radiatus]KAI8089074.1 hypothetical protein BX664DRAFT_332108 [Halteromyces radiatus]